MWKAHALPSKHTMSKQRRYNVAATSRQTRLGFKVSEYLEWIRCVKGPCSAQQTHNVETTSLQRRCNVVTLQRRCNDVVSALRGLCPANTQCRNNVVTTSLQRRDVAATLLRRYFGITCLLGEHTRICALATRMQLFKTIFATSRR